MFCKRHNGLCSMTVDDIDLHNLFSTVDTSVGTPAETKALKEHSSNRTGVKEVILSVREKR